MGKSENRRRLKKLRAEKNLCVYCGKQPPEHPKKGCNLCLKNKVKITKSYAKKHKDRQKLYRKKVKQKTIEKYGNKCSCCGEKELYFLCIDHIENNGGKERKSYYGKNSISSTQFYLSLLKADIRTDLQVLCFNCNLGKQINNGICPHLKPSPANFIPEQDLRKIKRLNINTKITWPDDQDLINDVNNIGLKTTAEKLKIHPDSIRQRLKRRKMYHLIKLWNSPKKK